MVRGSVGQYPPNVGHFVVFRCQKVVSKDVLHHSSSYELGKQFSL
jgi:hypothetical protein